MRVPRATFVRRRKLRVWLDVVRNCALETYALIIMFPIWGSAWAAILIGKLHGCALTLTRGRKQNRKR
jgi:hypothetical protein